MSANVEAKKAIVEEIKAKIQASKSIVLADYNKLTVLEVTELRRKFKAANCEYKVYKNTLVRRAFNELGITDFDADLNGTTATVFCADETSGAAVFAKEKEFAVKNGKEWLESAEGKQELKRIKAKEASKTEAEEIRFLIDNNASPMTPMVIEQTQFPKLSEAYAEQMTKSIDVSLQEHPYYHSLRNTMLANTLKAGTEAPDITLPLLGGEIKHLEDYRGKHVILNFWNDATQAAEMMTELKSVYELTREQRDGFVILSISLNSDVAAWKEAVKTLGIDREGWLHACDGAGANSPAAKRYGIEATPRIILIEPEGHAVSLDMEIDELALRIEQILSGDLYYLDEVK